MKRKKSVRSICRSLKTIFLPTIAVVLSVVTPQASVASAYSPSQQPSRVLIVLLMGRTEKVTVDMSASATNTEIVVKGQGLRGREQAEQLVGRLVATQQASVISNEDHS